MSFNKRHISTIALCIYIATICTLCFINPANLPTTEFDLWGIGLDKLIHFLMFLPFPILAYFSFSKETKFIIWIVGCLFALSTECIQSLSEYRSFEIGDIVADILGLTLGCTLTFIIHTLTKRTRNDQ